MPVLELLLFGVGVSIGGKRAWRKLTGQDDEEEEATVPPESSPPGSPRKSPPASPRRRNDDGLKLLVEDVTEIFSPRGPRASGNHGSPRTPSSPQQSPRSHTEASASTAQPPPTPPQQAQPAPARKWWEGGGDASWWHAPSPRVDSAEAPRGAQDQRVASSAGEDEAVEDDSGGFWKFLFSKAPSSESPQVSPRQPSHPAERGGDDLEVILRNALRALAGDNNKHSPTQTDQQGTPHTPKTEWSASLTPRCSALRAESPRGSTPQRGKASSKGQRISFAKTPHSVQTFVECDDELRSRRKHWEGIMKNAEKEAFEAYVSSGKHRKRLAAEEAKSSKHSNGSNNGSSGSRASIRQIFFPTSSGSEKSKTSPTKSPSASPSSLRSKSPTSSKRPPTSPPTSNGVPKIKSDDSNGNGLVKSKVDGSDKLVGTPSPQLAARQLFASPSPVPKLDLSALGKR